MSSFQSDTITFLFTDIEGSTRLWDSVTDAMAAALRKHDSIFRNAIERHEGRVFKTVGDAFCAAFGAATSALSAAFEAQCELQTTDWGDVGAIRARCALHTGEPEQRDDDFFGQPLNRVARLLSTGHGEQILMTNPTEELVRDALPKGASLRDLGSHRLRDLTRPERIFQLVHPDIRGEFPPLKTLESYPNNLPLQLTTLIGRDDEVKEVCGRLSEARFLTLLGPGGVGKTRIALQVGADVLDAHADGVWFIELAAVSDAALIPSAVASELGIAEEPKRPLLTTILDRLRSKRMLIILDNCEHLIESCGRLADALLRGCPHIRLLATSREIIGIAGEFIWHAHPLRTPEPSALPTSERLTQFEAVQLFIERARAVNPAFAVTDENAADVAHICWSLDGIPLLIELVVARLRVLSLRQISEKLQDRFRLLTGGNRAALPRQQTYKALIDWSYDLLAEPEQRLFRRLSVFESPFSLTQAEELCSGDGIEDWEVLDLLSRLVDRSLVMIVESNEDARYRLLETLRAYGAQRLKESDENDRLRQRHAEAILAFSEGARPALAGKGQVEALRQLDARFDDLRAALRWSLERCPVTAFRLVAALGRYAELRGFYAEARMWMERCLERCGDAPPEIQAKMYLWAARSLWGTEDSARATALFQRSYDKALEAGSERDAADALRFIASLRRTEGSYAEAESCYGEILRIVEKIGDRDGYGDTLHDLGTLALDVGNNDEARERHLESLRIRRELGDVADIAASLSALGSVAIAEGRYVSAKRLLHESLDLNRRVGAKLWEASALRRLARAHRELGEHEDARKCLIESLHIARDLDKSSLAKAFEGFAELAMEQKRYHRAMNLLSVAKALRRTLRTPLPQSVQGRFDEYDAVLRAALGDEFHGSTALASAPLDEAIAYALDDSLHA